MRTTPTLAVVAIALAAGTAAADTTPQTLPYQQDWSAPAPETPDSWADVPGWVGYQGGALTSDPGVNPQTILVDGSSTAVDIAISIATPNTYTTGGVAEFTLPDRVIALAGSNTADAPHLVLHLDTTGVTEVHVRYTLRDLETDSENAAQQVALQYRVGATGDFIDIGEAYVADASNTNTDPGLVTPRSIVLPAAAGNQPLVFLRWITTDAQGADEWIGIDDVEVTPPPTELAATGLATPAQQATGGPVTLTATVTPGLYPTSTSVAVVCDASQIGGAASLALLDDGTGDDAAADDGVYTATVTVGAVANAAYTLPCAVTDAETRQTAFLIAVETVTAACPDGVTQGLETCDDNDAIDGDGCSATCTVEPGFTCSGTPSTCADIDECTDGLDDCVDNATCANTEPGFTCTCADGYEGDGHAGGTGCTDVDECAATPAPCSPFATCTDQEPGFLCACEGGYQGDGTTCAPICGDDVIVTGETCDDGGAETGDGCDAACAIEDGWACENQPSDCQPICGDGDVIGFEECDDAGEVDGDGCSATCAVEEGWNCDGEPSTCSEAILCGDGTIDAGEACDDGNMESEDGCDATCTEEDGWICEGEPSQCVADDDLDGVPDAADNCPDVPNANQADDDGDDVGNACDEDAALEDDGGGCCSSSDDPRSAAGFALLGLLTLMTMRRRRPARRRA